MTISHQTTVSVPPHKTSRNPTTQPPIKTGGVGTTGVGSIKGFGVGAAHSSSINAERGVTKDSMGKAPVRGFSGSGVKSGKA